MSIVVRGVPGLGLALLMLAAVSCSSADDSTVVPDATSGFAAAMTTDAAPVSIEPAAPAPAMNLVDPSRFAYSRGLGGYYFTTPSGLWTCAILPDSANVGGYDRMAGCNPGEGVELNVKGAPDVSVFRSESSGRPNSIFVGRTEEPIFASLSQAVFRREDSTTSVLGYGETLAVDEFSCNVQETGVSCRSDSSGKGFSFSTEGFRFEYIDAAGQPAGGAPNAVAAVEPVLGRVWGPDQQGYGEARPTRVFNGGSLSGLVEDIAWQDWGGALATGSGESRNLQNATGVATAPIEPVAVVAYDVGDCEGTTMYRSLVWFFPSNGETFDSVKDQSSIHPCREAAYREPGAEVGGGSCGVVTAEDGIARDVFVEQGSITCADGLGMMHATYPLLYDLPMDGMGYGSWNCGIIPAGEVLFTCNDPGVGGRVVLYRSADDPYR